MLRASVSVGTTVNEKGRRQVDICCGGRTAGEDQLEPAAISRADRLQECAKISSSAPGTAAHLVQFFSAVMIMKLKDITPPAFACHECKTCPALFESDNNTYVLIGKRLPKSVIEQLSGRIGADELAIEVPKGIIDGMGKS